MQMNKKMILPAVILLVVAIALAAGGFAGLNLKRAEEANASSPYVQCSEQCEYYIAESTGFIEKAQQAISNIGNYKTQIETNRDFMAEQGGDTAEFETLITEVDGYVTAAGEELTKMQEQLDKQNELFASCTEESSEEELNDAVSKVNKRRNNVERSLKTITKIELTESTKSYETLAKQACLQSEQYLKTAYPDAELPTQFSVEESDDFENEVATKQSFAEWCAANYQYFFWLAACALIGAILCLIGWTKPTTLKTIGHAANKNMMLVALVVITLIFFVLTNYTILTPVNVSNIISQNAYIIILACGMLLCIVCSSYIDLSVGRVIGFVGACAAKFMIDGKMNPFLAIILCLLIGIAIGMWQGFWIAYMHIPAFITTLAGQLSFYGLCMMILHGFTIAGFPKVFQTMFCSYIPDLFPGLFGDMNAFAMLIGILAAAIVIFMQIRSRASRRAKGYSLEPLGGMIARTAIVAAVILWLFWSLAKAKGIPSVLITVGIVLLVYAYITSKTVLGRHLYAMGGNVNAARLSGVKTQKMLFLAYVNMGFLAALAGLVYASRLNAASPQAGDGDELYAIASCYIGGASAYGGIGTIGGALIGALTMGIIKNGMSIMGLGQDVQQIVLGLVLLFAVVVDVVSKQNVKLPFHFGKKKA